MIKEPLNFLSLPVPFSSTSPLPFGTLSNPSSLSFISTLCFHFSLFALFSRIYTYHRLNSVPRYSFVLFLLQCRFPQPSHRDIFTMRVLHSKMWTFFFSRLSCPGVWLENAGANYRQRLSCATFVDWVLGKVNTLCAGAPPSVRELVQLMVSGSYPDM